MAKSVNIEENWNAYFDEKIFVKNESIEHAVYRKTIHAKSELGSNSSKTIIFFHHGAGLSALSFACLVGQLSKMIQKEQEVTADIPCVDLVCFDARGHGYSKCDIKSESSLMDLKSLSRDSIKILTTLYEDTIDKNEYIFVGHSLGASVLVDAALCSDIFKNHLMGVVIIDVTEGTAMESLATMDKFLSYRPVFFKTQNDAVNWAVSTKNPSNFESARISVPSLITPSSSGDGYVWRTPLSDTRAFWNGWFQELSEKFLKVRGGKLLMLAGTDRLDKTLTLAQIQGKFQMTILNHVGHLVHEDAPEEVASHLLQFWKRNARLNLPAHIRAKIRPN